jgi:N-acetylglucosamine kinase-like BadF-type ATPase
VGVTEGPCVLAVDGGNSKSDVAVVRSDGALLTLERGPGFRPHVDGVEASVDALSPVVSAALDRAGRPPVALVKACLANADLPVEEELIAADLRRRGWAERVSVVNDTFAVLRAGTDEPRGVAVVCGAGINCVGLLPNGRAARFLALGRITGDWGGGADLAEEVMWWAVRCEDGRGPSTALSPAVAGHFGAPSAIAVAEQLHLGGIARHRLHELVPVLFRVADAGDEVARSLVLRQADEVVSMASVALRRLGLDREPADVVLGGGVLAAGDARLTSSIAAGLARTAPSATVRVLSAPPVLGAVMLGLDDLATGSPARRRRVMSAQEFVRAQLASTPQALDGG